MNRIVVDASLAIKWVTDEEYKVEADFLKNVWNRDRTIRVVPSWFACEITNVAYQSLRTKGRSLRQAQIAVTEILEEVAVTEFNGNVSIRAMQIAHEAKQRASYDAHYVALAEHLECDLWTADERFWRSTHASFPFVKWLGNVVIVDDAT